MSNQIISQILLYLTDFSDFIKKLTGDNGAVGSDYNKLFILFFVFAVLLIAISLGRSRMLLALMSIYAAVFLEPRFVYFDKLKESLVPSWPDYWLRLSIFIVIYLVVVGLLNRSFLKGRLSLSESSILVAILMSISIIGLLVSVLYSYLPVEIVGKIPSYILPYISTNNAQFCWGTAPIVLLLFSKNKKTRLRTSSVEE